MAQPGDENEMVESQPSTYPEHPEESQPLNPSKSAGHYPVSKLEVERKYNQDICFIESQRAELPRRTGRNSAYPSWRGEHWFVR